MGKYGIDRVCYNSAGAISLPRRQFLIKALINTDRKVDCIRAYRKVIPFIKSLKIDNYLALGLLELVISREIWSKPNANLSYNLKIKLKPSVMSG